MSISTPIYIYVYIPERRLNLVAPVGLRTRQVQVRVSRTWNELRSSSSPAEKRQRSRVNPRRNVRLTTWALSPFLVVVLSAAAAIRKLPHTILTLEK